MKKAFVVTSVLLNVILVPPAALTMYTFSKKHVRDYVKKRVIDGVSEAIYGPPTPNVTRMRDHKRGSSGR